MNILQSTQIFQSYDSISVVVEVAFTASSDQQFWEINASKEKRGKDVDDGFCHKALGTLELENKFNVHNISQNSIIAPIFYLL
jgi:hypothetical protein